MPSKSTSVKMWLANSQFSLGLHQICSTNKSTWANLEQFIHITTMLGQLACYIYFLHWGLEWTQGWRCWVGVTRSKQCCKFTSFIPMNLFAGMKDVFCLKPIFFTKHLFVKGCFSLLWITVISLAPSNITHYTVTIWYPCHPLGEILLDKRNKAVEGIDLLYSKAMN